MNLDLTRLGDYSDDFLEAAGTLIHTELQERKYIANHQQQSETLNLTHLEYIRRNRVHMDEAWSRTEAAWRSEGIE